MYKSIAAIMLLSLAGCGNGPKSEASQVMALVNGKEITVQQFNDAIQQFGVKGNPVAIRQELSEKLVDRELAVQQALKDKLDRKPEVMRQMEEARHDVLARAFARQIAMTGERPSEEAAAHYYSMHPELFSQRKIFLLRMMAWPVEMKELPELRNRIASGEPVNKLVDWLGKQQVTYRRELVIRLAEELPETIVKKLSETKPGDAIFLDNQRGMIAYQVVSTEPAPMEWKDAKAEILTTLSRKNGMVAVDNELRHLRSVASIEYVGEFAHATAKKIVLNP